MKSAPAKNKKRSLAGKTIKDKAFPIVAIGASAGGLEAITQLLKALPANTGMAFIYLQHLSPDHKSILTSLLSKLTLMKVQEVKNNMPIEPDNFYVIPPDKEMAMIDGHIKLTPRGKDRTVHLPIDTFFRSLAEKHKESAIGIILSGSASDGTGGLSAIKEAGGLTFAQDDSAKFSSMPKSAITAGVVDLVLSPKEIAQELIHLGRHDHMKREGSRAGKEDEIGNGDPGLKIILDLLHDETEVNFSLYKMAMIKRRILRRMLLYKIRSVKEYAKLMTEKRDEVNILYQDLLINVTSFFRDTEAHRYLKATLLPKLLRSKPGGEILRIWIPACSTGEEAYSIAMTILEIQSSRDTNIGIQIFASDLSKKAIAKARAGEYSIHELESVPPKLLQRFYTKQGGNYRITKAVRDICVFTPHNILRDPPFSRVDFISCCNLLIYLDSTAQKKAITAFHYALNDGGYLMLGKSETTGASGHLFARINSKFKIYSRKNNSEPRKLPDLLPPSQRIVFPEKDVNIRSLKNRLIHNNGFDSAIDAILLSSFMPASVVINHAMEIIQFRGATDLYLKHLPGKASLNILKLTPPEIAFELRTVISKAIKAKQSVRKTGIEIKRGASFRTISVEVFPLTIEWDEPLLLVLFTEPEQIETFSQQEKGGKNNSLAKDRRIKKLEEELSAIRADMQAFTQEQDAFNEELQSANEEVVSSNEELQSVNEELETSKEEIESTNEELITTNQELQTRNDLLNESYNYSEAIIATIHEPMVILDKNLRVRSANRSFYKNFRVKEKETEGTLLYDLGNKQWNIPRLSELLEDIIPKNTQFHDFEVIHTFPDIGKKIMLLNANRIVQERHGVQLILLAIQDVTEVRMKTLELQRVEKELFNKNVSERKAEKIGLEEAVEERTKELEQVNRVLLFQNEEKEKRAAELLIANKELAFQNEEKGKRAEELIIVNKELLSFNYISSHDLQEPLRKIQTFAGRILEKEVFNLSDTGKNHFQRILSAAGRMRQLIEDLLVYSRTNIAERKFEKTDLNVIMEEVKAELKENIEEKHAIIEATEICEMNVIPFQFRQIMHNLIHNALKFSSPERPPHILIKSRIVKGNRSNNGKLLADKSYCHISVTDNGIGFEPQYKDRIFEVFQKLHSKEEYEGTGIGLAIVKKIVENHNGIITATSELNKGATFDIYMPVIED